MLLLSDDDDDGPKANKDNIHENAPYTVTSNRRGKALPWLNGHLVGIKVYSGLDENVGRDLSLKKRTSQIQNFPGILDWDCG